MKHPEKWRETVDPYGLPYKNFILTEVLGYPHAGNDVFYAKGIYRQKEVLVYVKAARQAGADIANEIAVIRELQLGLAPQILDCDEREGRFVVTLAKTGERLSVILGENENRDSLDYMYEYGQTLAKLHRIQGNFGEVKDRRFFHIPEKSGFALSGLEFVYDYLISNQPKEVNKCFCHGDFHYANILWVNKHISAILDFELSGMGSREFDIAWALILRPGQRFLNTGEEAELFMEGYLSAGTCNLEYVKYYMVLIYSYFINFQNNTSEYRNYVMRVFEEFCHGRGGRDV